MKSERVPGPEASEASEARSEAPALPDEVLAQIFGLVTDGPTLLDVLPLVCQSWRRVARHPASWAGVRFVIDTSGAFKRIMLQTDRARTLARALLHAPVAASLEVLGPSDPGPLLQSALRRSGASVRVLDCACYSELFWKHVAPFLYRQRELRVLRLRLRCRSHRATFEDMMTAEIKVPRCARDKYDGELAGPHPKLRELVLQDLRVEHRLPERFVADLVHGAVALRQLDLDVHPVDADIFETLEQPVVAVEHLSLVLKAKGPDAFWELRKSAGSAVALCRLMDPCLQSVTLHLHHQVSSDHPGDDWSLFCKGLFSAVASALPDIKVTIEDL
ncbi:uncharacterized protein LOC117638940 [Thrips palmi]|uniref:Uncharacterized protein LOC117638940 n=1 Tax=Thrips palmi TaxID=161013 RepID=A0A6P8ZGG5_THRPL|nr:uncharacterized protein LOC117638940 [Thrips palmi]